MYHDDEYVDLMAELQGMLEQQQQHQAIGGNDDDDVHVKQGKGKRGKKGTKSSKKSKSSKKGKKGGLSDRYVVFVPELFLIFLGVPSASLHGCDFFLLPRLIMFLFYHFQR